jgi:hypothetical protein
MRTHRLIALLLPFLLTTVPAPGRAQDGPDSLWAKAVFLYEANDDWVPGSVYMHVQEVDKHGEPKDNKGHEAWTRLFLNDEGEVDSELIKVLDNGEDVTEEEKAKIEEEEAERDEDEGEGDEGVAIEGYTPFDAEHQGGLKFRATGEPEMVSGRHCVVFEFEDERENGDDGEESTVMGRVWLEADTGVPFKMEYTTDPLPKRVKKMDTTVYYAYDGPEDWYAESMSMQATGGILFIKKHFHMNMTFSEFWRMPEGDEEGAGSAREDTNSAGEAAGSAREDADSAGEAAGSVEDGTDSAMEREQDTAGE